MRFKLLLIIFIFLFTCSLLAEPNWEPVFYPGLGTTFYGNINIAGLPAEPQDLLGVFVEGECRAVAPPNSDGLVAGLLINGENGLSEMLQFRLWDADNNVISDFPDLVPITHTGDNLFQDLFFNTPEILESQISIVGDNQVQGNAVFQVLMQSYQGVAQSWNINAIEFELHFDPTVIDYQVYQTAGFLSEGNSVEIFDQGSFITVSISGDLMAGIEPVIALNFLTLVNNGFCFLVPQNFVFRDIYNNEYPINDLTGLEMEIILVNNPPYNADFINNYVLQEEFDPVSIDLSNYFADDDGDELDFSKSYWTNGEYGINSYISGSMLTISFSNPDYFGIGWMTVWAEDPYGESTAQSFEIEVLNVNDPPVLDLPGEFVFNYAEEVTIDFSPYVSDIDNYFSYPPVDDLSLSCSDSEVMDITINDMQVTINPIPDWFGADFLTFTLSDGQLSDTQSTWVTFEMLPIVLTADFSADSTQIPLGTPVFFENQSAIPPDAEVSWFWDFQNDGIIDSYEENPAFLYPEAGTYSVELMIYDQFGNSDTELKENYISVGDVNLPPVITLNLDSAYPGDDLRIYGENFGGFAEGCGIMINGELYPDIITCWSDTAVFCAPPYLPLQGILLNIGIRTAQGLESNTLPLEMYFPEEVEFLQPHAGAVLSGDFVRLLVSPVIREDLIASAIFEYRPVGFNDWIFIDEIFEPEAWSLNDNLHNLDEEGIMIDWDISNILNETEIELRATLTDVYGRELAGTHSVTVDQYPDCACLPGPGWLQPQHIASRAIDNDSLHINFEIKDEAVTWVDVFVNPLAQIQGFNRIVPPVCQDFVVYNDSQGRDVAPNACGPASAASCLKWLACKAPNSALATKNAGQIADDMAKFAKTDSVKGTSVGNMKSGVEKLFEEYDGLNKDDWEVSLYPDGKTSSGIANKMISSLCDSSDVVLFIEQFVQKDGQTKKLGHAVTMSSYHTYPSYSMNGWSIEKEVITTVDFMDPYSGETIEYQLDTSVNPPRILNYSLADDSLQASTPVVKGFMSVKKKNRFSDDDYFYVTTIPVNGTGDYIASIASTALPEGILEMRLTAHTSEDDFMNTDLICLNLNYEMIPEFYAEETNAAAPAVIQFHDASTPADSIAARQWDFNDDGTIDSTDPHPIWVYEAPGSYSVSLTVTDINGESQTVFKENYINIYEDNFLYLSDLNKESALPGDLIKAYGENLGEMNADSGIMIDDILYQDIITFWSSNEVYFHLPYFPQSDVLQISIQKNAEFITNPLDLIYELPQAVHFIYPSENEVIYGDELLISVTPDIRSDLITSATFSYRPQGSTDWIYIGEDTDGSGLNMSTYNPIQDGDGWSIIWDIFDVWEQEVEIKATLTTVWDFELEGTRSVSIDRQSPRPWIDYHPWQETDSAGSQAVDQDSLVFEFTEFDESAVGVELEFRLLGQQYYQRELESCEQEWVSATDSLGREVSGMACGPSSAASCLKWLANKENITELANKNVLDLADELCEESDTDSVTGTTVGNLISGINEVLDNTNGTSANDWEIGGFHHTQENIDIYDEMTAALYDSSDVILFVEQTDQNGNKMGHAVTMSSHSMMGNYQFIEDIGCVYYERYMVDFMNPATGQTEYYELDRSADPPELIGYQLDPGNPQTNQPRIVGGLTIKPKENSRPQSEIITYDFPLNGSGNYRIAVDCRDLPAGVMEATLRGISSDGSSGESKLVCTVEDYSLLPNFTAQPLSGPAPLEVQFNNMSSPADSIIAYQWDFDDLGTSAEDDPLFTFTQPGSYNITLTATDVYGNSLSISKEDYITVTAGNHPPEIDLPGSVSFNEDDLLTMDFSEFVSDPDDDSLAVVASGYQNINVAIDDLLVTFTPLPNWYGSENITFIVYDNTSRLNASDQIMVTVNPVNDTPQIDLPDELPLNPLGELHPDPFIDLFDFTIEYDNDDLTFNVSEPLELTVAISGSLLYISAPACWTGSEYLTVCVSDGQSRLTACDSMLVYKEMNPCPNLTAINDVPDDQGGWVFVNFTASCLDTASIITRPSQQYTVEYLVDDVWTAANTVTAYGAPSYQVLVHTLQDSMPGSPALYDFRVIASMDEGNFASNILPGYSLDNLSPQIPAGFIFDNGWLVWDEPVDEDFAYFSVYLNNEYLLDTIEPQINLIGLSGEFQLAAVDFHANCSQLSPPLTGGYPYGDIDHNLSIEAMDAALVLQYFCLLITDWENWQQTVADVDGNGSVEAFDAALILQYTVGYIDNFPIENLTRNK